MSNINTIPHEISQTPTTPQSLRDKDSREIDFSKWLVGEHGSESISSEERAFEERAFEGRFIANYTELTSCALKPNPTFPFQGQTCMELSTREILGGDYFKPSKSPNESDLPSSSPCPYPRRSNLDHQNPSLEQVVTYRQTEPDPWTVGNEKWDFLEKILNDDRSEFSNLLDESDLPSSFSPEQGVTYKQTEPDHWNIGNEDLAFIEKILKGDCFELSNLLDESDPPSSFSPSPYPRRSNLDHQKPSLEQGVTYKQTKPDLSTMGHKESPLVEPLLSTEGESTANRTSQKSGKRPKPRKVLNSIIFILMNWNLNIPLPENENFSKKTSVYSYFNLWQKDEVLKSVLALLEQEAQEPLKSHYQSLVKNFQEASNCQRNRASLYSLRLKFKFDEIVELPFQGVTDEQWLLIERLLVKNEKLEHWSISDQEWALVESLLSTKVENTTNQQPRKALNSLLFLLMKGKPNIPLRRDPVPRDPDFSIKKTMYGYFNLWQKDGVLKSVLALLEQEAQEPLKSHYRSLVKNFQEASNCQANRASLHSLGLKFDEPVKLSFQGVTDEQWIFIQPLLSKAVQRAALNLIFSLLITRASSFASSNLTERNEATEYLALWKKDGTLENVLTRLIAVTQGRGQSDYLKMLNHLQNLTAQPIPQPQPQPTSNEEYDLMIDDQSGLDHQGSSPRQVVKRREDDPELCRISDREWNLVEPLFKEEVKGIGDPRKALNLLLFILINGEDSTPLPRNLNFSAKRTAEVYFLVWQANKVLEKVLPLLEKESQEPLQSYYRKLLKNLQEISNLKTKPLSISNFNKKFGQAGSGFQGVTDRQWTVIDPLLNKKIMKSGGHHRRDLNSIFSVIMNGVPTGEIPVTSNFSARTTFYKYFIDWKKDGTLEKVLNRLIEEAQGRLQSDYQKVLDRVLQEDLNLDYMGQLAKYDKQKN